MEVLTETSVANGPFSIAMLNNQRVPFYGHVDREDDHSDFGYFHDQSICVIPMNEGKSTNYFLNP